MCLLNLFALSTESITLLLLAIELYHSQPPGGEGHLLVLKILVVCDSARFFAIHYQIHLANIAIPI